MSYVEPRDSGRKAAGMVVVVVFHIALGYALVQGLARKIVEVVRQPLETKIVEEIKPPPEKPPPPPPKLVTPPPPYIPPPEIQVQVPVSAPTITAVTTVKPPEPVPPPAKPAPPPKPHVPVRMAPVVDAKQCEKPPYPAASLRANETGTVRLNFLIDVDGKVLESRIERSSGSSRLDEAARSGLALCKFRPATVDGKPERSWARIEYEWKIE